MSSEMSKKIVDDEAADRSIYKTGSEAHEKKTQGNSDTFSNMAPSLQHSISTKANRTSRNGTLTMPHISQVDHIRSLSDQFIHRELDAEGLVQFSSDCAQCPIGSLVCAGRRGYVEADDMVECLVRPVSRRRLFTTIPRDDRLDALELQVTRRPMIELDPRSWRRRQGIRHTMSAMDRI